MKFGSKQLRLFSSLEKVLEKQLLTKKIKFSSFLRLFSTQTLTFLEISLNVKGQFISNGSIILISLSFVHYFRLEFILQTSNKITFEWHFIIFWKKCCSKTEKKTFHINHFIWWFRNSLLSLVSNQFWYSDKRIKLIRIWLEPTEGQEDAGVTYLNQIQRRQIDIHLS
jgi:hypothetical protein